MNNFSIWTSGVDLCSNMVLSRKSPLELLPAQDKEHVKLLSAESRAQLTMLPRLFVLWLFPVALQGFILVNM